MQGKISINLWPTSRQDALLNKLYKLGIGNGISLSLHFGDYIEIVSFGADLDNHGMKNFYINPIQLLKRFVIYFRMQAKKFIHDLCCNNLIILKEKLTFCSSHADCLPKS